MNESSERAEKLDEFLEELESLQHTYGFIVDGDSDDSYPCLVDVENDFEFNGWMSPQTYYDYLRGTI